MWAQRKSPLGYRRPVPSSHHYFTSAFKHEYPHVWAMSGCQVGQQEEGAEKPAGTVRVSLVRCLEPIGLTDTLHWALLPFLHHHGIF